jgi:hypothetical protein
LFRWRFFGYDLQPNGGDFWAGGVDSSVGSANPLGDGGWHHFALTYDGATLAWYIDGALVASGPASGRLYYVQGGGVAIGRDGDACNGFLPSFRGDIAMVAVYPTALSPSRIMAHYVAASAQPPTAANDAYTATDNGSLTVNAAQGVLANDSAPNVNPLEAVLVSGPANGALGLNADGSFTYTPNSGFVGSDSFTYEAKDTVTGQVSAPATVTISVVYAWSGFLSPVNNPNTVNTGNAGRTYPVKWQLTDANGNFVTNAATGTTVTLATVSCSNLLGDPTDPLEITSTGSTSLRYDSTANQYIYNWATPTTSNNCYRLTVTLPDGVPHYALFSLK